MWTHKVHFAKSCSAAADILSGSFLKQKYFT